ncbi:MAG: dTDP-4-dehydrorhamnose reductase [Pseudomonadota bacterium]
MAGDRPMAVLGARGLVGSAVMEVMASESLIPLTRIECDLTRPGQVLQLMDRLRPGVFINCAAYTNVDGCEAAVEEALQVNALGPGYLAQAARDMDCLLVHLSTDFVFDGKTARPYKEDDPPAPLSVYGRTKLEGEKAVMAAGGDWLIVRTAWVYGHPRRGFVWRILDLARQGGELKVVDDQTGSPTYAQDLASGLYDLIQVKARGLFHLTNTGQATWWELARLTLDLSGHSQTPIKKITGSALNRPAVRPSFAPLDTTLYRTVTGKAPRPWPDALAEALKKEKEHE